MIENTKDMTTLESFMCALDGDRWSENSGPELTFLMSEAMNFAKFEDSGDHLPENMKVVDCGDKMVGVVVLTMDKN